MAGAPALGAETRARTLARFEEHRRAWEANAPLRALYAEWYGRVAAALPPASLGPRVELGSGPGFARAFIPDLERRERAREGPAREPAFATPCPR